MIVFRILKSKMECLLLCLKGETYFSMGSSSPSSKRDSSFFACYFLGDETVIFISFGLKGIPFFEYKDYLNILEDCLEIEGSFLVF